MDVGAEEIQNDYITYTGATFGNGDGVVAAVLIDSLRKAPPGVLRADYVARDTSILLSIRELSGELPISGMELRSVLIAVPQIRFLSMGKGLTIYVDNAVPWALVEGETRIASAHRSVSAFWWIVTMFPIRVWFERAPIAV